MEDLLENFSKHINKLISNKLGTKIRNLARATTNYRTDEDYSRVESNIQMLIESYLSNLKDNDYKEIANNIFNSFVDEDDKNLIKAINFFKSTYEHYQEMNLRKKFFKWRKISLKLKMINNLVEKERMAQQEKNLNLNNNIKNNNINNNKIIEQRYNDIDKDDNINDNERNGNPNTINGFSNDNFPYYLNNNNDNNFEQEDYFENSNNMFVNKNAENIEEFIEKGNINNQNYNFNYLNNNNDDYKEEFNEELDVNKLYSKNQ